MLSIQNLHAQYGPIPILKNCSLHIERGEIVTLIGANGAGKSTLLSTISGLLRPSSGSIQLEGSEIGGLSPSKIVSLGICQVPEGREIFSPLTVKENLELGAFLRRGKDQKKKVQEDMDYVLQLFPRLKERFTQPAGTLSGGEQQMLAIGRAIMARPKLLLLDEPSLGLAPKLVNVILETIKELNKEGLTILLVEQNARKALEIAHRGYVIETGRIVLQGTSSELKEDPEVKRAYLGKDYKEISERA
ncbi:Branched-chain amino acid transport ATP-binding protein LivF [Dissulfuribacter thermophilus]|uniref:Branched-chain amino acid transport ATP-binding protein LivF n=1 Tax=Dissulfuribacter thermophilus TaxID=1156395 RepID=A0A1B9F3W1_9BACT|nr:ABC transporter ATP-binding protein [Dissulfuribacter thermophilus]OCC14451.1 Branched-chain amino acid transport ATP-binding protein LivF [Dissulfuribacter thermophilus]